MQILECRGIGCDHSSARAAFNGHVADRHSLLHGQRANRGTGIFKNVPCTSADADLGNQGQDDVFGGYAFGQRSIHAHFVGIRLTLKQALCGKHVFDFGCANSKGQRTKRPMRSSVAITADYGHPGLG